MKCDLNRVEFKFFILLDFSVPFQFLLILREGSNNRQYTKSFFIFHLYVFFFWSEWNKKLCFALWHSPFLRARLAWYKCLMPLILIHAICIASGTSRGVKARRWTFNFHGNSCIEWDYVDVIFGASRAWKCEALEFTFGGFMFGFLFLLPLSWNVFFCELRGIFFKENNWNIYKK